MVETEVKFQPTEEQYKSLLEGAEFIAHKQYRDIYYDYPDFHLLKKGIRLRDRNGFLELKVKQIENTNLEKDKEEEIKKILNIQGDLRETIAKDFCVIMDYITDREKYKKEGFNIDVDKLDFGFEVCEIEIMNQENEPLDGIKEKIIDFAKKFSIEYKKLPSKAQEYLKKFNPEKYKEIYKTEENNSIKIH